MLLIKQVYVIRDIYFSLFLFSIWFTSNVKDYRNEGGINVLVTDEIVKGVDIFFQLSKKMFHHINLKNRYDYLFIYSVFITISL